MKHKFFLFASLLLVLGSAFACNSLGNFWGTGAPSVLRLDDPEMIYLQSQGTGVPALAFQPTGQRLALISDSRSSDNSQVLELWDLAQQRIENSLPIRQSKVQSLAFSQDGLTLATASDDGIISFYDSEQLTLRLTLTVTQSLHSIGFSPDGKLVAAMGKQRIWVWQLDTQQLVSTISFVPSEGKPNAEISFSGDSQSLLTQDDNAITLWSVKDGKAVTSIPYADPGLCRARFFPSDMTVASCARNGTVQMIANSKLDPSYSIPGEGNATNSIAITQDQGLLVAIGVHGSGGKGVAELPITQLSVWRWRDQATLGKFDVAAGVIYQHLTLSPNQEWLALSSGDLGDVVLIPFFTWLAESAGAKCPSGTKDADGYLQKICISLLAQGTDVSPGKPGQYEIVAREEMVMNGRSVIQLRLNCCYMGDIAYIDTITGAVIDFRVGAK